MIHESPDDPTIWICPLCGERRLLPLEHLARDHHPDLRIVDFLGSVTCVGCQERLISRGSSIQDAAAEYQHVKSCEKLQLWLAQQKILEVAK
jgi:hypothetical protein